MIGQKNFIMNKIIKGYAFWCLLMMNAASVSAQITVSGQVSDQITHEPIVGATIVYKKIGTKTDLNGRFTLDRVIENDTIEIGFLGYNKLSLPAKSDIGFIRLSQLSTDLRLLVVTASRDAERRMNAP